MLFNEGESSQTLYIDVINDADPELDETFQLQLTNPTGGSVLGSQGAIDVVIATNDNAYGIIGFAEVSLNFPCQIPTCSVRTCVNVHMYLMSCTQCMYV